MKATRFMRVPFFVTGCEVTEDNMDVIALWCEGHVVKSTDGNPMFVRVPVNRPTNRKQTEAYPGTWVILSTQRGDRSFKVYTEEWLMKQFFEIPDEGLDEEIPDVVEEPKVVAPVPGPKRAVPVQFRSNSGVRSATS